jgi:hypothetical protein
MRVPQSPEELNAALVAIFPRFCTAGPESEEPQCGCSISFHSLMREFAYFFGKEVASFTPKQLQRVGELLVCSVEHGGALENAVSTCFLEHARQLKVNRQLAPWLSKARVSRGA